MEIKFKDMRGVQIALVELGKNRLGMKVNHWVDRWFERIGKEIEIVEKSRLKLCEKYCKKDKDGKCVMKQEGDQSHYEIDDLKSFEKEYNELLEQSIDVDLRPLILDDKDIKMEPFLQKLLYPICDPEFIKSLED